MRGGWGMDRTAGRGCCARGIWQSRALEGIAEAVTAMTHLMDDAFKRGRTEDAEHIAGVVEAVSAAAGLPEWMGLSARLELAEIRGGGEEHGGMMERV